MTTKPRRKATQKVPARPTPIEATQVLAYRGQLGEMGAETNHRDVLDLIRKMIDPVGEFPPTIAAGIERGFPGLVAASKASNVELLAILNGLA